MTQYGAGVIASHHISLIYSSLSCLPLLLEAREQDFEVKICGCLCVG